MIKRACCPHARGGEPPGASLTIAIESVVPTPVGVNRSITAVLKACSRCPHARGGEPVAAVQRPSSAIVVPTPVGVNRVFGLRPPSAREVVPTPVGVNRCEPPVA